MENDSIKENFDDDLSDIPYSQRDKIAGLYKFGLQKKLNLYGAYLPILTKNSDERIKKDKNFQNFLKELQKKDELKDIPEDNQTEKFGLNDLQLMETYSVMKDLIMLMMEHGDGIGKESGVRSQ